MLDLAFDYLTQLFELIPTIIVIIIIFDFLGSFFFGKN